jgi:hypothetical protein
MDWGSKRRLIEQVVSFFEKSIDILQKGYIYKFE